MASGTFDLLHPGHGIYLQEAKNLGGYKSKLYVVVARDSTVEKRKRVPIVGENQRLELIKMLKPVDEAAYLQNQSFTGLFPGSRSNSWHRSRFVIYWQIHLTAVILSRIDGFDTYNLNQAILPENIIHARGMEEISKDCDKYTQRSKDGCVPAALPDFLSERL